jgi:glutamine cyclotransferase
MRMMRVIGLTLILLIGLVGIQAQDGYDPVEQLTINVLNTYPHDTNAFTQGLLVGEDGLLYESTGRYGQSSVRAVEPETGEVLAAFSTSGGVLRRGVGSGGQSFDPDYMARTSGDCV